LNFFDIPRARWINRMHCELQKLSSV